MGGTGAVRGLRYAGLLLLAVLLVWAGPSRLVAALGQVQPAWLLLAWLLNIPQVGLKTWRWVLLARWQGAALGYFPGLLAYFSSLFIGFLTPGRVGELAKALTLKTTCGWTLAASLPSVVLDRAFDMYLLLTLGTLGIVRFALVGTLMSWPVFLLLCLLLASPLLALHPTTARGMGAWAARLPGLQERAIWIRERTDQFAEGLEMLTLNRATFCALLTVAAYAIFFCQCQCCAWAMGLRIPWLDLVLLMSATNFLSFVPISVSGLGTREACLVFFLGRVTPPQPMEAAVVYGILVFLVFFVGAGVMGFASWQWAPLPLQSAVRQARKGALPTRDQPQPQDQ